MENLPPEVLYPIASHAKELGPSTVLSLLLISRQLFHVAEKVIYESIDTRDVWAIDRMRHFPSESERINSYDKRHMSVLQTLGNGQRLADHVRSFSSHRETDSGPDTCHIDFAEIFARALDRLRNLKSLIFGAGYGDWIDMAYAVDQGSFELEHFTWFRATSAEIVELFLRPFLLRQESLRSLQLWEWRMTSIDEDLKKAVPELTILCGSYSTCFVFLPGRKHIALLVPALTQLERLEFDCSDSRIWSGIAVHLTNLRFLNLINMKGGDTQVLTEIPWLEHIKLSHGKRYSAGRPYFNAIFFIPNQTEFLDALFGQLQHLQIIDVDEKTIVGFNRYFRGRVLEPEYIFGSIFEWDMTTYR